MRRRILSLILVFSMVLNTIPLRNFYIMAEDMGSPETVVQYPEEIPLTSTTPTAITTDEVTVTLEGITPTTGASYMFENVQFSEQGDISDTSGYFAVSVDTGTVKTTAVEELTNLQLVNTLYMQNTTVPVSSDKAIYYNFSETATFEDIANAIKSLEFTLEGTLEQNVKIDVIKYFPMENSKTDVRTLEYKEGHYRFFEDETYLQTTSESALIVVPSEDENYAELLALFDSEYYDVEDGVIGEYTGENFEIITATKTVSFADLGSPQTRSLQNLYVYEGTNYLMGDQSGSGPANPISYDSALTKVQTNSPTIYTDVTIHLMSDVTMGKKFTPKAGQKVTIQKASTGCTIPGADPLPTVSPVITRTSGILATQSCFYGTNANTFMTFNDVAFTYSGSAEIDIHGALIQNLNAEVVFDNVDIYGFNTYKSVIYTGDGRNGETPDTTGSVTIKNSIIHDNMITPDSPAPFAPAIICNEQSNLVIMDSVIEANTGTTAGSVVYTGGDTASAYKATTTISSSNIQYNSFPNADGLITVSTTNGGTNITIDDAGNSGNPTVITDNISKSTIKATAFAGLTLKGKVSIVNNKNTIAAVNCATHDFEIAGGKIEIFGNDDAFPAANPEQNVWLQSYYEIELTNTLSPLSKIGVDVGAGYPTSASSTPREIVNSPGGFLNSASVTSFQDDHQTPTATLSYFKGADGVVGGTDDKIQYAFSTPNEGNYYVDPDYTATDANGTQAKPFPTMQEAVNDMVTEVDNTPPSEYTIYLMDDVVSTAPIFTTADEPWLAGRTINIEKTDTATGYNGDSVPASPAITRDYDGQTALIKNSNFDLTLENIALNQGATPITQGGTATPIALDITSYTILNNVVITDFHSTVSGISVIGLDGTADLIMNNCTIKDCYDVNTIISNRSNGEFHMYENIITGNNPKSSIVYTGEQTNKTFVHGLTMTNNNLTSDGTFSGTINSGTSLFDLYDGKLYIFADTSSVLIANNKVETGIYGERFADELNIQGGTNGVNIINNTVSPAKGAVYQTAQAVNKEGITVGGMITVNNNVDINGIPRNVCLQSINNVLKQTDDLTGSEIHVVVNDTPLLLPRNILVPSMSNPAASYVDNEIRYDSNTGYGLAFNVATDEIYLTSYDNGGNYYVSDEYTGQSSNGSPTMPFKSLDDAFEDIAVDKASGVITTADTITIQVMDDIIAKEPAIPASVDNMLDNLKITVKPADMGYNGAATPIKPTITRNYTNTAETKAFFENDEFELTLNNVILTQGAASVAGAVPLALNAYGHGIMVLDDVVIDGFNSSVAGSSVISISGSGKLDAKDTTIENCTGIDNVIKVDSLTTNSLNMYNPTITNCSPKENIINQISSNSKTTLKGLTMTGNNITNTGNAGGSINANSELINIGDGKFNLGPSDATDGVVARGVDISSNMSESGINLTSSTDEVNIYGGTAGISIINNTVGAASGAINGQCDVSDIRVGGKIVVKDNKDIALNSRNILLGTNVVMKQAADLTGSEMHVILGDSLPISIPRNILIPGGNNPMASYVNSVIKYDGSPSNELVFNTTTNVIYLGAIDNSGDYYVSKDFTGTSNGKSDAPFKTLEDALADIVADDTISHITGPITIHMMSDITTANAAIPTDAVSLTHLAGLNITIKPSTIQFATNPVPVQPAIKLNGNIATLFDNSNFNLTLDNIQLTQVAAPLTAANPAAIKVSGSGVVKLNNVKIDGINATGVSSIITIENGGKIETRDITIENCDNMDNIIENKGTAIDALVMYNTTVKDSSPAKSVINQNGTGKTTLKGLTMTNNYLTNDDLATGSIVAGSSIINVEDGSFILSPSDALDGVVASVVNINNNKAESIIDFETGADNVELKGNSLGISIENNTVSGTSGAINGKCDISDIKIGGKVIVKDNKDGTIPRNILLAPNVVMKQTSALIGSDLRVVVGETVIPTSPKRFVLIPGGMNPTQVIIDNVIKYEGSVVNELRFETSSNSIYLTTFDNEGDYYVSKDFPLGSDSNGSTDAPFRTLEEAFADIISDNATTPITTPIMVHLMSDVTASTTVVTPAQSTALVGLDITIKPSAVAYAGNIVPARPIITHGAFDATLFNNSDYKIAFEGVQLSGTGNITNVAFLTLASSGKATFDNIIINGSGMTGTFKTISVADTAELRIKNTKFQNIHGSDIVYNNATNNAVTLLNTTFENCSPTSSLINQNNTGTTTIKGLDVSIGNYLTNDGISTGTIDSGSAIIKIGDGKLILDKSTSADFPEETPITSASKVSVIQNSTADDIMAVGANATLELLTDVNISNNKVGNGYALKVPNDKVYIGGKVIIQSNGVGRNVYLLNNTKLQLKTNLDPTAKIMFECATYPTAVGDKRDILVANGANPQASEISKFTDEHTPKETRILHNATPAKLYLEKYDANDFYVSASGTSTGVGTYNDPIDTIQNAVNKIHIQGVNDATIYIMDNNYNITEPVNFDDISLLVASRKITISTTDKNLAGVSVTPSTAMYSANRNFTDSVNDDSKTLFKATDPNLSIVFKDIKIGSNDVATTANGGIINASGGADITLDHSVIYNQSNNDAASSGIKVDGIVGNPSELSIINGTTIGGVSGANKYATLIDASTGTSTVTVKDSAITGNIVGTVIKCSDIVMLEASIGNKVDISNNKIAGTSAVTNVGNNFSINGEVDIYNNTVDGTASGVQKNVFLDANKTIKTTGAIAGSKIGVSVLEAEYPYISTLLDEKIAEGSIIVTEAICFIDDHVPQSCDVEFAATNSVVLSPKPNGGAYYVKSTADPLDANGLYTSPYATIEAAMLAINANAAFGVEQTPTIYIMDNITMVGGTSLTGPNASGKTVTITTTDKDSNGAVYTGLDFNIKRPATMAAPMFKVDTAGATLKFDEINIDGANQVNTLPAIEVTDGTVVIDNAEISQHNVTANEVLSVSGSGILDINNTVSIKNNTAGSVVDIAGGTLTLDGATISDNNVSTNIIDMSGTSVVSLNGASIKNNTVPTGYAIKHNGSALNMQGNVEVYDNTSDGTISGIQHNVYLDNNTINATAAIGAGSKIGVSIVGANYPFKEGKPAVTIATGTIATGDEALFIDDHVPKSAIKAFQAPASVVLKAPENLGKYYVKSDANPVIANGMPATPYKTIEAAMVAINANLDIASTIYMMDNVTMTTGVTVNTTESITITTTDVNTNGSPYIGSNVSIKTPVNMLAPMFNVNLAGAALNFKNINLDGGNLANPNPAVAVNVGTAGMDNVKVGYHKSSANGIITVLGSSTLNLKNTSIVDNTTSKDVIDIGGSSIINMEGTSIKSNEVPTGYAINYDAGTINIKDTVEISDNTDDGTTFGTKNNVYLNGKTFKVTGTLINSDIGISVASGYPNLQTDPDLAIAEAANGVLTVVDTVHFKDDNALQSAVVTYRDDVDLSATPDKIVLAAPSLHGSYYVSSTANHFGANGSLSAPFPTIEAAMDAVLLVPVASGANATIYLMDDIAMTTSGSKFTGANANGKTINITTTDFDADTSPHTALEGVSKIITPPGMVAPMFTVDTAGATLKFNNVIIDGVNQANNQTVVMASNGTVDIANTDILNHDNTADGLFSVSGSARVGIRSTATIHNNNATNIVKNTGGIVALETASAKPINNNTATNIIDATGGTTAVKGDGITGNTLSGSVINMTGVTTVVYLLGPTTIAGNIVPTGYAVNYTDGIFQIKGSITINNNTDNGTPAGVQRNVLLANGKTIKTKGAVTGSDIGVSVDPTIYPFVSTMNDVPIVEDGVGGTLSTSEEAYFKDNRVPQVAEINYEAGAPDKIVLRAPSNIDGYYVNPQADPSEANGTIKYPYKTVEDAMNAVFDKTVAEEAVATIYIMDDITLSENGVALTGANANGKTVNIKTTDRDYDYGTDIATPHTATDISKIITQAGMVAPMFKVDTANAKLNFDSIILDGNGKANTFPVINASNGTVGITNAEIIDHDNTASGIISVSGTAVLDIRNVVSITNNKATSIINIDNSTATIDTATIESNEVTGDVIDLNGALAVLSLKGTTSIKNNEVPNGFAIDHNGSALEMNGTTQVYNNTDDGNVTGIQHNVFLNTGKTIKTTGAIATGSNVGVSTEAVYPYVAGKADVTIVENGAGATLSTEIGYFQDDHVPAVAIKTFMAGTPDKIALRAPANDGKYYVKEQSPPIANANGSVTYPYQSIEDAVAAMDQMTATGLEATPTIYIMNEVTIDTGITIGSASAGKNITVKTTDFDDGLSTPHTGGTESIITPPSMTAPMFKVNEPTATLKFDDIILDGDNKTNPQPVIEAVSGKVEITNADILNHNNTASGIIAVSGTAVVDINGTTDIYQNIANSFMDITSGTVTIATLPTNPVTNNTTANLFKISGGKLTLNGATIMGNTVSGNIIDMTGNAIVSLIGASINNNTISPTGYAINHDGRALGMSGAVTVYNNTNSGTQRNVFLNMGKTIIAIASITGSNVGVSVEAAYPYVAGMAGVTILTEANGVTIGTADEAYFKDDYQPAVATIKYESGTPDKIVLKAPANNGKYYVKEQSPPITNANGSVAYPYQSIEAAVAAMDQMPATGFEANPTIYIMNKVTINTGVTIGSASASKTITVKTTDFDDAVSTPHVGGTESIKTPLNMIAPMFKVTEQTAVLKFDDIILDGDDKANAQPIIEATSGKVEIANTDILKHENTANGIICISGTAVLDIKDTTAIYNNVAKSIIDIANGTATIDTLAANPITDNKVTNLINISGGTTTISGDGITENRDSISNIIDISGGMLKLDGATITENTVSGNVININGATTVVSLENDGTTGTSIKDNTVAGYAINHNGRTLEMKDTVVVYDNTVDGNPTGKQKNVYLNNGKTINATAVISAGSNIGISVVGALYPYVSGKPDITIANGIVSTGNEAYFKDDHIPQSAIVDYKTTPDRVVLTAPENEGKYYVHPSADPTVANGMPTTPYKTIEDAINAIDQMLPIGNEIRPTIYVMDDVTMGSGITVGSAANGKAITVATSDINPASPTVSIKTPANMQAPMFNVNEQNATLIFDNIKLDGATQANANSVITANDGNVEINDTEISGHNNNSADGLISISGAGKLKLDNAKIKDNTVMGYAIDYDGNLIEMAGTAEIYNNTSGAVQHNVLLKNGKSIKVAGNIAGSKIGVSVPVATYPYSQNNVDVPIATKIGTTFTIAEKDCFLDDHNPIIATKEIVSGTPNQIALSAPKNNGKYYVKEQNPPIANANGTVDYPYQTIEAAVAAMNLMPASSSLDEASPKIYIMNEVTMGAGVTIGSASTNKEITVTTTDVNPVGVPKIIKPAGMTATMFKVNEEYATLKFDNIILDGGNVTSSPVPAIECIDGKVVIANTKIFNHKNAAGGVISLSSTGILDIKNTTAINNNDAKSIIDIAGGTATIDTSILTPITLNKAANIINVSGGTTTIKGDGITGNNDASINNIINVSTGGILNLEDVTITGNTADQNIIEMNDTTTVVSLKGVTAIGGNTLTSPTGYAIKYDDGTLIVEGKVNTTQDEGHNVFLGSGKVMKLTGRMVAGSKVGVNSQDINLVTETYLIEVLESGGTTPIQGERQYFIDESDHQSALTNIIYEPTAFGQPELCLKKLWRAKAPTINIEPTGYSIFVGGTIPTPNPVAVTYTPPTEPVTGVISVKWYKTTDPTIVDVTDVAHVTEVTPYALSEVDNLDGTFTTTLAIPNNVPSDGYYFCVVTNTNIAATAYKVIETTSQVARVIVSGKPTVTIDSSDATDPTDPTLPTVTVEQPQPLNPGVVVVVVDAGGNIVTPTIDPNTGFPTYPDLSSGEYELLPIPAPGTTVNPAMIGTGIPMVIMDSIDITTGYEEVTITNVSVDNVYLVLDKNGNSVQGVTWVVGEADGEITINGLDEGREYQICVAPEDPNNPGQPKPNAIYKPGTPFITLTRPPIPNVVIHDKTPTSITISATDDAFGYALIDKESSTPNDIIVINGIDWIQGDTNGGTVTFNSLDPDHEYEVICIKWIDSINDVHPDANNLPNTMVDLPGVTVLTPINPANITNTTTAITINSTNSNFSYNIIDPATGKTVTTWVPSTAGGSITFGNLNPDTVYEVVAVPIGQEPLGNFAPVWPLYPNVTTKKTEKVNIVLPPIVGGGNASGNESGDGDSGGDDYESTLYPTAKPTPTPDIEKPVVIDSGVSENLNTTDHIAYLAGYENGLFRPQGNATRAEVAQMFYNLMLDQSASGDDTTFNDVNSDDWYAEAVNTLASQNILNGYPDGSFKPNAYITRAEFVTIACTFASEIEGDGSFSDVPDSHWASDEIKMAVEYGWITGYPDGTFKPDQPITRAEATVVINNMLNRTPDKAYIDTNNVAGFTDVSEEYWAYYEIMEATTEHNHEYAVGVEVWKAPNMK